MAPGRGAQPGLSDGLTENGARLGTPLERFTLGWWCECKRKATCQNEKKLLQALTSDFTSQSFLGSFWLRSALAHYLIIPTELDDAFTGESKNLELWRNQATVSCVASEMCVEQS